MTIDNEDFKIIFDVAFNIENINTLKCFECGRTLQEKINLTGLTCENAHDIGYLEYMTQYTSFINDIVENSDFNATFDKKVIKPSNIIYATNNIIFCDKLVVRN